MNFELEFFYKDHASTYPADSYLINNNSIKLYQSGGEVRIVTLYNVVDVKITTN